MRGGGSGVVCDVSGGSGAESRAWGVRDLRYVIYDVSAKPWGGELETMKKLKNKIKGVDLTCCVVRLAFCRWCLTVYVVSRGLHGAFSPFEGGVSTVCWQSRCLDFCLAKIGRCG